MMGAAGARGGEGVASLSLARPREKEATPPCRSVAGGVAATLFGASLSSGARPRGARVAARSVVVLAATSPAAARAERRARLAGGEGPGNGGLAPLSRGGGRRLAARGGGRGAKGRKGPPKSARARARPRSPGGGAMRDRHSEAPRVQDNIAGLALVSHLGLHGGQEKRGGGLWRGVIGPCFFKKGGVSLFLLSLLASWETGTRV